MKGIIAGVLIGIAIIISIFFIFRKKVYLSPEKQKVLAATLYEKAKKFEEKGDIKKAIRVYEKIVKRCPASYQRELSLYKLFYIYKDKLKKLKKALEIGRMYLMYCSRIRGSEIAFEMGEIYRIFYKKIDEAISLYRKAMKLKTKLEWILKSYQALSLIFYEKGKIEEVIKMNNFIIENFKDRIDEDFYHLLNVKAYWRIGKVKDAYNEAKKIKDYNKVFVKHEIIFWKVITNFEKNNSFAWRMLGNNYFRLGFKDEAKEVWRKAELLKRKEKLKK
ncbi:MAG: hypothetical protein DRI36_05170 [Caldiserica bacterium]|nr:MAG: hypothetical protein DRI36_05170 [Caldisericota bacterium]